MLTRWNDFGFGDFDQSFGALGGLRREMDRLWNGFERGYELGRGGPRPRADNAWPRVSLYDTGSELKLRAELPGVSNKGLQITVEQSSLSLRGERPVSSPEGYSVHRQERGALKFSRSFTLPCRVDTDKASANLKDGVLELTLPKAPEEQPRQIRVQAV